jgi:hypothetical protein
LLSKVVQAMDVAVTVVDFMLAFERNADTLEDGLAAITSRSRPSSPRGTRFRFEKPLAGQGKDSHRAETSWQGIGRNGRETCGQVSAGSALIPYRGPSAGCVAWHHGDTPRRPSPGGEDPGMEYPYFQPASKTTSWLFTTRSQLARR